MGKMTAFFRTTHKLLNDNSPTILTALGVAGLVGTVVAAVKATPAAVRDIMDAESERTEPLTSREKVTLTWKHYIPAAAIGSITGLCIISSNSINSRRNATLISLYTLTDKTLGEYREKVVSILGEQKEQKVRDALAQDQVNSSPNQEIVIFGSGNVLCFDTLTGRHFESNVEKIRKAENDVNRQCINDMYASQNDFYRLIGLPAIAIGEEVGWTTDNPIDVTFSSVLSENKPVLAINYVRQPKIGYHKLW